MLLRCPNCKQEKKMILQRWYDRWKEKSEWDYQEFYCPDCGYDPPDDYTDMFVNEVADNIEIVYRCRIDCQTMPERVRRDHCDIAVQRLAQEILI